MLGRIGVRVVACFRRRCLACVKLCRSFQRTSQPSPSGDGEQWDLICVGSRLNMGEHVDFDEEHTVPGVMRIRNYRNCHTHAYAIRPRAASLLIAKAEEEGIICGMDWFMVRYSASPYELLRFHALPSWPARRHGSSERHCGT
ncbi:hypothetical protein GUITHDRAFT_156406 [Guillardia theta CCMP2712]|uniref:Uncharacterized protein n=1 Tax=Guillardia theta (strain CCMP2712) TaxID=905079 RepID=L1I7A2_GUITC|nr:hypothetical protein GUITHDRAFT_156406 [Guillardia theta CCMP2712]EKX32133.1 hypothetical protein GUITHDRAFT_156406 [Guillardia theta CCMP2712]|eukprot:XP_005819113.1 hypothetical protein GUITHDRAFT_156406 [Guillardia theta CCMP2712]